MKKTEFERGYHLGRQDARNASLSRPSHSERDSALEEAARVCEVTGDAAYCRACEMAKDELCLGEDYKLETGQFKRDNLKAIEAVRSEFGKHYGLHQAAKAIRSLISRPLAQRGEGEQNAVPQDTARDGGREAVAGLGNGKPAALVVPEQVPAGTAPTSPASAGMPEDEFTQVHNTLNMVDMLLVEAGFTFDASVRHNLAIAKSQLRQVELDALRAAAPGVVNKEKA